MAVDRATLLRLAAALREDVAAIERVLGVLDTCGPRFRDRAPDAIELHGVAGYLHDFYSGIENALERVAPVLNGALPAGPRWHRDLLEAMSLDVPDLRPPVLRRETVKRLEQYLRFRHRYRQMYAYDLDWEPVAELVGGARSVWSEARADLERFAAFLETAAAALA